MEKSDKIYVAGHTGMVGSAICRLLTQEGYSNIIGVTSSDLDLRVQADVDQFFRKERPEYVFMAAGKVGGIVANSSLRADFIVDNILMATNVLKASKENQVTKLLYLGSSCIYPRSALQPIKEEYLLTGQLEPTNEPYAIAKIAGIKMCDAYRAQYGCNFISAMPTNLYGPNDNYNLETAHVLPALLRKFHEAKINDKKEVVIWGTGKPRREFMHVDDLAHACLSLMLNYSEIGPINLGTGSDISIDELAKIIKSIVGFEGEIVHDLGRPDGVDRKLLDIGKMSGHRIRARIGLETGIRDTYKWCINNQEFFK